MKKELHCTSIDCTSRRSLCCDAKCEAGSYGVGNYGDYACSECKGEFIPREHSCGLVMDWRDIDKKDTCGAFIQATVLGDITCMEFLPCKIHSKKEDVY